MFSLSIALGNTQWRLMYRKVEDAEKAWAILNQPASPVQLDDDFGQRIVVKSQQIAGVMFEDMDKSKMANVALMLFNTSVQMTAQKQVQSDPAFRAAAQGPAIVSPMGNGRFNG